MPKESEAAAIAGGIPGYVAPPFAGMVVLDADSAEKISEIFTDEEYLRVIRPDEDKFFVRQEIQLYMGPIITIFEK